MGNYDFYLKKIKGESLWPNVSFKNWPVKLLILLVIGAGAFVFFRNLSHNFHQGFGESKQAIENIDRTIEEQLGVRCDIDWEVHISPTRNIYDLDIQLTLRSGQIFDQKSRERIEEIVQDKLDGQGETARIKTCVAYEE